jgi:hypothetical protein
MTIDTTPLPTRRRSATLAIALSIATLFSLACHDEQAPPVDQLSLRPSFDKHSVARQIDCEVSIK